MMSQAPILKHFILARNPFFDAYLESDFLGKVIFIGLITLSIWSWTILFQKLWMTIKVKRLANRFQEVFRMQKFNPLSLDVSFAQEEKERNPFLEVYQVIKKHTLEMLNKNRQFGQTESQKGSGISYLSTADIDFVESQLMTTISNQTKQLEKNLFFLSTIVALAPFLGLLGTVWGILTTFSELQIHSGGTSHQSVLAGLSLALAATVLGLIAAIPALVGYNYLKHNIRDFQTDMECFSNEVLASVELQYRQVDLK
jgi:biopolymer transport protein TolQ